MKFIKLTAITYTHNKNRGLPETEHRNACWFNVADISAISPSEEGGTLIRPCGFDVWEEVGESMERVMQLLVTTPTAFSPDAQVVLSS